MNTPKLQAWLLAWLLFATSAIQAQVTADFTVNNDASCSPLVARFTDQSSGNITSWKWFFGNGNSSNQQNPGAVYVQPGFKTVTLIVSDGVVSDTMVKTNFIHVFQDPEADFVPAFTQGCTPFEVCFNDSSIAGSAPIVEWLWDFGDGGSSTQQNPCNTYNTPGNYTVTLMVVDSNGCESIIVYPDLIEASDFVTADFTANVTAACEPPLQVNFTSLSSSPSLVHKWLYGNGQNSHQINPTVTYNAPGEYDVRLVVVNSFGCTDTMLKPGYIAIEPLEAGFTANVTQGCVGLPVSFTDTSSSNPNIWRWDFGDGTTDSVQNPVHTYNSPGTYTVKLFAANSGSCMDSTEKVGYITINSSPQADFTGANLSACQAPLTSQFTDNSTNAVAWLWQFGDGDSSTVRNPSHTYTTAGSYTVTLTVFNADSCSNTMVKPAFVNIVPPQANLVGDSVRGCLPHTVNFADSSISNETIVSWFWDFGDGATSTMQNPSHIYTNPGSYDVSLIIVNDEGCTDTVTRSNYVRAGNKPAANFTANTFDICLYGSINFTDQSVGDVNEWLWFFGDGNTSIEENPTYAYSDTGTFTVRLIATSFGCRDTFERVDYIHVSPPDARFYIEQHCDDPYTVIFHDNSLAPDTWFWEFGDGTSDTAQNPVHTFSGRGTYTVSLTVTDSSSGCFDIEAIPVYITDPKAGFEADTLMGCRPFSVQFADSSISADAYRWLSDGMVSTAANPTFVYNTPGVYSVTQIVTDIHGCSDTLVRPDYITVLGPTALFGATPLNGCAPLEVDFIDTSAAFMSPIVAWKWKFGDGDSSLLQNPQHLYDSTARYNVSLTVTDGNGCVHTTLKPQYIRPTFPTPAFVGDTQTCIGTPINLTSQSAGVNLTYFWDFGDNSTSTLRNPSHAYADTGKYTITLTVTDVNGCDSTIVMPDFVNVSEPVTNFTADSTFSPCPPLVVNFVDSSTSDIVSWFWDFGDGLTSTLQNPAHVYLTPGDYSVTMIGTTAKGCSDTIVKSNFVVVKGPTGTFNFTPRNGCMGNEVLFTANTQNAVGFTWDFGDGTLQSGGDTITHVYPAIGVNYPTLILDDGLGCILAVPSEDSVVVGELTLDFAVDTNYLCKSGTVRFTNLSTSFPATSSYRWLFGDGASSTQTNPTHTYTTPGWKTITLIASNAYCSDTLVRQQYIAVDAGPAAEFYISEPFGCVPQKITFTDSTQSDSTLANWYWDFGNGLYDSTANPVITYNDTGSYNVQLIVSSVTGCADTIVKSLVVNPIPTVVAMHDTMLCMGDTISLNVSGAATYSWYPGNTLSDSTVQTPLAAPTATTTYYVTGTDTNGCIHSDTMQVVVNNLPVADAGADEEICAGESIELNGSGGVYYQWQPAATVDCQTCASVVATPPATTQYVLEVENQFKCFDTDTVQVTVHPLPQGIVNADTAICDGESVQLSSLGGVDHIWTPSAGLSCTTCPDPIATPDSTTLYELTLQNQFGCTTIDSVVITVNPNPIVTITGDDLLCEGQSTQLVATGGVGYSWAPSAGLSCDDCAEPVATPLETTTYSLTVSSSFGCTTVDSFTIDVKPNPTVETIEDITICNGNAIELTTAHTLGYRFNWTPADGLDDAGAQSPVASPERTTTYVVTAETEFGCLATDEVTVSVLDKVSVSLTDDMAICFGEIVDLNTDVLATGHEGTQFVWNPVNNINDANLPGITVQPNETRTYTVIAYSGSCIPDTQAVTITVNQLPDIQPSVIDPVVEGTPVTLAVESSHNIVAYNWSPSYNLNCADCEKPSLLAEQSETYNVRITDDKGCEADADIPVTVVGACGDDIFVPAAFSPNGDGKNDVLYLRGRGLSGLKTFRLFDRWGNLVFETDNIEEGFNGVYHGKLLGPCVLVYYYEAICSNGFVVSGKGNVTILR